MSGRFVVDASVAAKWYLPEADSAKAAVLLTGAAELHAPTLLRVEIAAAITRRHRMGALTEQDALLKLYHARQFVAEPSMILTDDEVIIERAGEIALQILHPLQDCLYIACAEHVGAELITTDAGLIKRAAAFPFVRAF